VPANPLRDRRTGLPLLPTLADQLADQGTPVLAGFRQELLQAVLGFVVQPDGERAWCAGTTTRMTK